MQGVLEMQYRRRNQRGTLEAASLLIKSIGTKVLL